MITSIEILGAAQRVAGQAGVVDEREQDIHISGLLHVEQVDFWRSVVASASSLGIESVSIVDQFGGSVDLGAARSSDIADVRILIVKRKIAGRARFLTIDGFRSYLDESASHPAVASVAIAAEFASFRTTRCSFIPWDSGAISEIAHDPLLAKRAHCRELSVDSSPTDVRAWILSQPEPESSEVFTAWQSASVKRLACALGSESWRVGDGYFISLIGQRKKTIQIESDVPDNLSLISSQLNRAAEWIYSDDRESETRHTLLASELANDWPEGAQFFDGFSKVADDALSAARMVYGLHLQGLAEKTMKLLGDLRKSLSEDVLKMSQQSRDLLGTLWRDFTVALTAVVGRTLLILADKEAANSVAMHTMLVVIAIFMGASAYITLSTNSKYAALAKTTLEAWRPKLYGFLEPEQFEALAGSQLRKAEAIYGSTARIVKILYFASIVLLLAFACYRPRIALPQTPTPTQASGAVKVLPGGLVKDPAPIRNDSITVKPADSTSLAKPSRIADTSTRAAAVRKP